VFTYSPHNVYNIAVGTPCIQRLEFSDSASCTNCHTSVGTSSQFKVCNLDATPERGSREVEDSEALALKVLKVGIGGKAGPQLLESFAVCRVPKCGQVDRRRRVRDDAEPDGGARRHRAGSRGTRIGSNPGKVHGNVVYHVDIEGIAAAPYTDVSTDIAEQPETRAVPVLHAAEIHFDRRGGDGAKLTMRERVAGGIPVSCDRGRPQRKTVVDSEVRGVGVVVPANGEHA